MGNGEIHEISRMLGNIEATLAQHAEAHKSILENLECLQDGVQSSKSAREQLSTSVGELTTRVASLESKVDGYERAQAWAKGAVAGISLLIGGGFVKGLDWLSGVLDKLSDI